METKMKLTSLQFPRNQCRYIISTYIHMQMHVYVYICIYIIYLYGYRERERESNDLQQLNIAGYHETMIILAAGAKFTGTLTMAQAPSAVFADLRSSSRPQKWCITSSMQKRTIIFGPMKKEDDFKILSYL